MLFKIEKQKEHLYWSDVFYDGLKKTTSKVNRRRSPQKDRFDAPLFCHYHNSRIPGRVYPENLKILDYLFGNDLNHT